MMARRSVIPPDGATVEAGGHKWGVWRQRSYGGNWVMTV
jgi:hypothetical protein